MKSVLDNLKVRCLYYKMGLVSIDDVFGYLQALYDMKVLDCSDVLYIINYLTSIKIN